MKMYAVLRSDIFMDAGKAAAQAGHAFVHTTLEAQRIGPERLTLYHPNGSMGTRIVLKASLRQIRRLEQKFRAFGLPYYVVVDEGHVFPPDFTGKKIVTAIGVGPLMSEESDKLLSTFELFKVNRRRYKK
jgi:peptidyl-tRNA hydrolase